MMDEAMTQAYARLSMQELFIEVIYANWFAQLDEEAARQLSADMRRKLKSSYAAPDADPGAMETAALQIAHDCAVMGERLIDKIESREAEIRERLSQLRPNPPAQT